MLHYLPSSCSRRQRYQVSLLPLSSPLPANKSTKTKRNFLDSGGVATQVPLISRTGTLPHDLPFRFCHRRQTAVSVRPRFPFLSSLLPSSAVWRSQPLSAVPVPPHLETFRRFDDSPIPLPTLLSHRGPQHRFYAKHQREAFR